MPPSPIPIDPTPPDDELRAAVHAVIEPVVAAARERYGPLPALRSTQWHAAPAELQRAVLLVCGAAWCVHDPDQAARQRLREMSWDLSAAHDWTAAARRPSHAELQRRRNQLSPTAAATAGIGPAAVGEVA